jgi:hypothetical protein
MLRQVFRERGGKQPAARDTEPSGEGIRGVEQLVGAGDRDLHTGA